MPTANVNLTDSDKSRPRVSVVITCFNQARYLADAVESVRKQTYPAIDLVIVDDGSTDETPMMASQFSDAHFISQANAGLSAARNTGLHHARGKYIAFLDADDLLLPAGIAHGIACHQSNTGCAFVYGGYRLVSVDRNVLWQGISPLRHDGYASFLRENVVAMHGTVLYDREILFSEGGFDTSFEACEDYDTYLRLARKYPVSFHHALVADYRQHDSNMSRDNQLMLRTSVNVLRAHKEHAKSNQAHRRAYRAGLRSWQSFYGGLLITQALGELRLRGQRGVAMRRLFWAMTNAPTTFMTHTPGICLRLGARAIGRQLPSPFQSFLRTVFGPKATLQ